MADEAYLVIREGAKWSNVFRLTAQPATLGRAPTCQIVLQDDRCSRAHAEVCRQGDGWILKDLDSRNGTFVGDEPVREPRLLVPGDVVRIGHTQLVFVHSLAEAFEGGPPTPIPEPPPAPPAEDITAGELVELIPARIVHRRGQTRFLSSSADEGSVSKMGRAATHLCRLAFELAKSPDIPALASLAVGGLLQGTGAEAAAILLLPSSGKAAAERLTIVASQTAAGARYHPISRFLAKTVMEGGEAVLARNVLGDSALGSRDSRGEILTTSVLAAPIRRGETTYGVAHLYTTDPQKNPDADDLEFTLAVADTVAVALENIKRRQDLAQDLSQVRTENVQLRERLGVQSEMVGQSAAVQHITEQIARAAASKATLLVRGESGVGKELVARAVHYSSPRAKHVFVCLNCAALSEELLASELFGHERGAFTGATERKIGKFEAADGGTLMLDEIGEMSPVIQAKFLRVLEGHPFERVGGSKPITADVRVVAATNRDLERDAAEGRFRRDLFFRLRVLEIVVPPLRKRAEDIPELARHFLEKFNTETGRRIRGFTDEAMQQLLDYRWPGNIRELKNVIERAVVLSTGDEIDQPDLLLSTISTGDTGELGPLALGFSPCSLADAERQHIQAILEHTGWNKSRAAAILGIERSTLDRKIRRYLLAEGDA